MILSIITPAFNEAENLPLFYQRLCETLSPVDMDWEWLIIDDHSTDQTYQVISRLVEKDQRIRSVRFARNFGSHAAIACGLHHVQGECAVVLAADLQDPPEKLPELIQEWRAGAHIVWAVRARREGEKLSTVGFSQLYHWLMRNVVGIKEIPPTGADFFLLDRQVIETFCRFSESNTSVIALLTWMGFKSSTVLYDKQARRYGHSGWSLRKKIKLAIDSITSFSYLPVRLMSYLGFVVALLGFLYAFIVLINGLAGYPPKGWASLMVVILVIGGAQMLMMGILGEYLWRTLDETRHRPRYIIESIVENRPGPNSEEP